MEVVIASRNIHKIRELRSMLKEFRHLDVLSLLDFPNYTPPDETGSSFEEIAIEKSTHAAKHLNRWAIADDSGLVVPVLSGAPGIHSARYAGPHATDAENRHKLLQEMSQVQESQRQGYFECWIAISAPEGLKKCVHGLCEGTITLEERGNRGFGYDAVFIKYEYGKTFSEIEETLKNRISHRRKAFDKLHTFLSGLSPK